MDKDFIKAVEESYKKYLTVHPRSSEKLKPIHSFIADLLNEKLGKGYEIKSLGFGNNKEYKFSGRYYDKNLDITVLKEGKPLSAIALKFVTTNYKQNGNNYFENMLGETANIKRNDLVYGQIIILRKDMPYYSTDKKMFTKIERINDENLKKYIKLDFDNAEGLYHKPNLVFMSLIDTGDVDIVRSNISNHEKIQKIKNFRIEKLLPKVKVKRLLSVDLPDLSDKTKDFISKHDSFEEFIDAFINLTKANEYGR